MILGAALLTACLFAGPKANAAPVVSPNSSVTVAPPVEAVGYYRYRRGYRPYRYWGPRYYRPNRYYRPYRYRGYGYRPRRRYGWRY